MESVNDLIAAVDFEQVGEHRYRAQHTAGGREVVFGGQLLAQTLMAAARGHEGKAAKTIHTVFARGASIAEPLDIEVDVMHTGRAFGSSSVTIRQGERLCTRSIVLFSGDEPDLMRHGVEAHDLPSPPTDRAADGTWQIELVGDVDIMDPFAVGPATLDVWSRFEGVESDDRRLHQALLSYATDGFLIATAMRPHHGVGQSQAHVTISTGVISHTLTFHEPFSASQWLLLRHESPYAGNGRTYGRAHVFTADGQLVASYVQDAMVRPLPTGHSPEGRERSYL
jgi:acyl-CoA thioesterase